jgi:hypothetical protein
MSECCETSLLPSHSARQTEISGEATTSNTMEVIVDQVKALAASADDVARKNILDALRGVSDAIETPQETMQRIIYRVCSEENHHRFVGSTHGECQSVLDILTLP